MIDIKTQNGQKRLVVNCATTKEVKELKRVILKELTKYPLGLKILNNGVGALLDKEVDFSGIIDFIKNVIINIDTSEEFDSAIYACLSHCTYDSTNVINEQLFDNNEKAREDYYEIIFACIEANLKPFMISLVSLWKVQSQRMDLSLLSNITTSMTSTK